jgi:hypothetical protein
MAKNYSGMAVNSCGITVKYHGILTIEKVGLKLPGNLLPYFYNIGPWGQCYKTIAAIFHGKLPP